MCLDSPSPSQVSSVTGSVQYISYRILGNLPCLPMGSHGFPGAIAGYHVSHGGMPWAPALEPAGAHDILTWLPWYSAGPRGTRRDAARPRAAYRGISLEFSARDVPLEVLRESHSAPRRIPRVSYVPQRGLPSYIVYFDVSSKIQINHSANAKGIGGRPLAPARGLLQDLVGSREIPWASTRPP